MADVSNPAEMAGLGTPRTLVVIFIALAAPNDAPAGEILLVAKLPLLNPSDKKSWDGAAGVDGGFSVASR